jgi:hypothetical protein
MRSAAAFASGWETEKKRYEDSPLFRDMIEQKMDGLVVAAAVDSFSAYLSELLTLIVSKQPGMIETRQIDVKRLWAGGTLSDLQWEAINEFVRDVSYKGFRELDSYLDKKFGFPLVTSPLTRTRMSYLYEVRNAVTHNRGRFSWVSDQRLKGRRRLIDKVAYAGSVVPVIAYISERMEEVDRRASSKFRLPALTRVEAFSPVSGTQND